MNSRAKFFGVVIDNISNESIIKTTVKVVFL